MKRGLIFFNLLAASLFLLNLFFASTIYATSGCCSGHGGVNCSAGPQYNGKVICNDGWTGSSCYYSEMVMCGGGYGYPTTPSCPLFSSYNSLSGKCECYSGYIAQGNSCVSGNGYCWNKYGYSSRYNFLRDSCECSYGYVFNSAGTKCISEDEACIEQYGYGAKATISGDKCECKYGYKWEGNRCVLDLSSDDDNYIYSYPATQSTNTPTISIKPTNAPTPKPTAIPTKKSSPTEIPTPEVKGETDEAVLSPTPAEKPSPTPTPAPSASEATIPVVGVSGVIGWIFYKYRNIVKDRFRRN